MSEFDRRLKVKPRIASGQCSIENASSIPYEIWDAEYVNLSGFCGPHNPHTFAAAPMMLEALRAIFAHFDNQNGGVLTGNAPGHGHTVPGVWDDDNSHALAGTKCQWCEVWANAKATIATAEGK